MPNCHRQPKINYWEQENYTLVLNEEYFASLNDFFSHPWFSIYSFLFVFTSCREAQILDKWPETQLSVRRWKQHILQPRSFRLPLPSLSIETFIWSFVQRRVLFARQPRWPRIKRHYGRRAGGRFSKWWCHCAIVQQSAGELCLPPIPAGVTIHVFATAAVIQTPKAAFTVTANHTRSWRYAVVVKQNVTCTPCRQMTSFQGCVTFNRAESGKKNGFVTDQNSKGKNQGSSLESFHQILGGTSNDETRKWMSPSTGMCESLQFLQSLCL